MKTLQFNTNSDGNIVLSDSENGQLFFPSDIQGNFLNVRPENYQSIQYVANGVEIFPVDFITEAGLGWLANAINAVASISSSIIGSQASKKANQSAELQLQAQQQIELLRAQTAERQNALINQQQSGMSSGEIIAIGVAGVAVVGAILYLVSTANTKEDIKVKADKKSK